MQLTASFALLLTTLLAASLPSVTAAPIDTSAGVLSFPLVPSQQPGQAAADPKVAFRRKVEHERRRIKRIADDAAFVARQAAPLAVAPAVKVPAAPASKLPAKPSAASSAKPVATSSAKAATVSSKLPAKPSATSAKPVSISSAVKSAASSATSVVSSATKSGAVSAKPTPTPADSTDDTAPAIAATLDEAEQQGSIHRTITPAVKPKAANAVGLDIDGQDDGYVMNVQIGTPPRNFKMLVDTGSTDFWVASETCQTIVAKGATPVDCGEHTFLGPKSSSSYVEKAGTQWKVAYGIGKVIGRLVTDNVQIGSLSLPAHPFGVAKKMSQDLSLAVTDGMIGFASSKFAKQAGQLNIVDSLVKAGKIAKPIAAFKFSRLADKKNDGQVTFGALDTTKFDPKTLVTVPNVNKFGLWEAAVPTTAVNGKPLTFTGARSALLDVGSNFITMPPADAEVTNLALGGQQASDGAWVLPCNTKSTLSFTLGGEVFTLNPVDLIVPVPDANNFCQSLVLADALPPQLENPDGWVLGVPFLKTAYTAFLYDKNAVQLAQLI